MEIINEKGKSTSTSGWRRQRVSWFHQTGLQVCSELGHVLLECTTLHEQGPMRGIIVLMEVVWDLELTSNICDKLKQVF
jgi:hypothetical protein